MFRSPATTSTYTDVYKKKIAVAAFLHHGGPAGQPCLLRVTNDVYSTFCPLPGISGKRVFVFASVGWHRGGWGVKRALSHSTDHTDR